MKNRCLSWVIENPICKCICLKMQCFTSSHLMYTIFNVLFEKKLTEISLPVFSLPSLVSNAFCTCAVLNVAANFRWQLSNLPTTSRGQSVFSSNDSTSKRHKYETSNVFRRVVHILYHISKRKGRWERERERGERVREEERVKAKEKKKKGK